MAIGAITTYWGNPQPDGSGGFTFDPPVHMPGKWEARDELVHDEGGEQYLSRTTVFLKYDVQVGGYLYEGLSHEPKPTDVEGARLIRDFRTIGNLRGTKKERRAIL